MTEPHLILAAIDADCALLDQLGKELDTVLEALELAQNAYDQEYEAELAVLVEEYGEKRVPGEDVRRALIHGRIDRSLYREVKRLSSLQDRLEKRGRMVEKALSGRQSELSFLKSEGQAPQPSWSQRAA